MSSPDNPQLDTTPRNPQGYVQLVRSYFDLQTDEAVVEAGREEVQRFNDGIPEMYRRYFITERIYPQEIPQPEQILAEWDPNGSKRSLRGRLEAIQADPERLGRLMDVVDESIMRNAPFKEARRMKRHFLLDQPGAEVDSLRPTEHYFWWENLSRTRSSFEYPIRHVLESQMLVPSTS